MRRKRAGQYLTFGMVTRADAAAWQGTLPEVYLVRDGAAQVAPANPVESLGNGQYRVLLTERETDVAMLGFVALANGAVLSEKLIYTTEGVGS